MRWRWVLVDALWDDAAFKKRVQSLAKARGMSMRAALEKAGITHRYLSRAQEGRSTNMLLNLARALEVSPAELFGMTEGASGGPPLPVDGEKLKRITVVAQVMAAQTAALIYVASNGTDVNLDPSELMRQIVSRVLNGDKPDEPQSGGKST